MKNNRLIMQKLFWALSLVLAAASPAFGQLDDAMEMEFMNGREKVRAARAAYITERLGLTSKEAAQFWAIHNEFETAKRALQTPRLGRKPDSSMSEAEAEQYLKDMLHQETALLELKKEYFARFAKVVPARKLVLFPQAEREFRLELLRTVRDRRNGRRY